MQHPRTGDWWLTVSPGDYQVGYWPKALFTGLSDRLTEIYWGGGVHGPIDDSPPTGSGHYASEQMRQACFMGILQIANESKCVGGC